MLLKRAFLFLCLFSSLSHTLNAGSKISWAKALSYSLAFGALPTSNQAFECSQNLCFAEEPSRSLQTRNPWDSVLTCPEGALLLAPETCLCPVSEEFSILFSPLVPFKPQFFPQCEKEDETALLAPQFPSSCREIFRTLMRELERQKKILRLEAP